MWRHSSAPTVLLLARSAAATAPHWFLYYCSSHDDIFHFVSSAFFLPLISIADYSASVDSDLMREPTELLLPSFTVIALCSPPAGPAQAACRAANNIDGGGDRHFYTSAEGCDWQLAHSCLNPTHTHCTCSSLHFHTNSQACNAPPLNICIWELTKIILYIFLVLFTFIQTCHLKHPVLFNRFRAWWAGASGAALKRGIPKN